MTSIRLLWLLLCLLWLGAEIRLRQRSHIDKSSLADYEHRSQGVLWLAFSGGLALALVFKTFAWMPVPIAYLPRQYVALVLFAAGLYLRYRAVVRLGQLFTTQVSIRHMHELITDGPYRKLRHPAYTGLLLALAAAGLAMGDALAMLAIIVPSFWALTVRIGIEERLLAKKFGQIYLDYCQSTWRLLPWLF